MKLFGDRMNLRGAAGGMVLAAMMLSGCLVGCADEDDGSAIADSTSGGKADLRIPSLGGAGTTSKGGTSGSAPHACAATQPPAPNHNCTDAAQCPSGFCVDGVCCNEACTGTCYSCNQAQSPGTCMPVSGAEDASADAPCAGANVCAVSADGQPACKLKSRAVCSTNAECASGSCGSIVVPPDPVDPYDVGYTYVGCE